MCSDPATIVFIRALDEGATEKAVISYLDDRHLFVRPDRIAWIKERVDAMAEKLFFSSDPQEDKAGEEDE